MVSIKKLFIKFFDWTKQIYLDKQAAKAAKAAHAAEVSKAEVEAAEANLRFLQAKARTAQANAKAAEAEAEAAELTARAAVVKYDVAAESSNVKAEAAFLELLNKKRQVQKDMETAIERHQQQIVVEMQKRGLYVTPPSRKAVQEYTVVENTMYETPEEQEARVFHEDMARSYR